MRTYGLLMILIGGLAVVPAMAQSTGQKTGKVVTHTTNTSSKMQSPGTKPRPSHLPTHVNTAVPLTKGECEGLGGKVDFNVSCSNKGQEGCYTADSNGVIHMACINK